MEIGILAHPPFRTAIFTAWLKGENFSGSDWQHFETAGDRGVIAMKTIASPMSTRRVAKFTRPAKFSI
jgi:hypothetical protein